MAKIKGPKKTNRYPDEFKIKAIQLADHPDILAKDVAEDVLRKPGEDRPGKENSRIAIGQTRAGRYLRVIYVPDPEPDSVFVITAYELVGKPLKAYRRRGRRRQIR